MRGSGGFTLDGVASVDLSVIVFIASEILAIASVFDRRMISNWLGPSGSGGGGPGVAISSSLSSIDPVLGGFSGVGSRSVSSSGVVILGGGVGRRVLVPSSSSDEVSGALNNSLV